MSGAVGAICAVLIAIAGNTVQACKPPLEEMAIVGVWYDPARCAEETWNCDGHPETFADGTAVDPEDYGHTAACLAEWLGLYIHFGPYSLDCTDTGGLITPYWSDAHQQWVIPVDRLLHEVPEDNYYLYVDWELSQGEQ